MSQNRAFVEDAIVASERKQRRYNIAIAAALFVASAAVVVTQNTRFVILWDASYILENASRISLGDVPYRDFPFPYAPLTFVLQAAIIKLFGHVYWHHIVYAAIAGGAATAITLKIARSFVDATSAVLLSVPLTVLGIYAIVPNPFYDPDCCLAILVILLFADRDSVGVGAACVVPFFIKQNIGLAFVCAALLLFAVTRRWRSVTGICAGAAIAAAVVGAVFGWSNYIHWTIEFASARRLPPLSQLLAIYADPAVWWWSAAALGGVLFKRASWLLAVPFLWIELRFFITDDPTEPEINLLRLWPVMILLALIATRRILPLLIVAAIHGAFLSQVVWGSTYGIWPLLILLIAMLRPNRAVAAIICLVLLHHGAWYIKNNRRLTYAKWDAGPPAHSTLPALRGMTMRGEWLPEFDGLVRWTDKNIPRGDGILYLPGEDLFYFATGRKPQFPVVMFDATVNPYSPAEIAERASNIRWLIVKERLQINGTPDADLVATLQRLRGFTLYASLPNYAIYRRF